MIGGCDCMAAHALEVAADMILEARRQADEAEMMLRLAVWRADALEARLREVTQ